MTDRSVLVTTQKHQPSQHQGTGWKHNMGLGTFISDKKQVAAGWESESSRVQTEEGRGTLGCFQNTSRSSRETETELQCLLWKILPHLKTPQSPLLWWWWWKRFVLIRSEAFLLSCPLLTSLPLPLWPSSHPSSHSPSWVQLKVWERPSVPSSSRGNRKGISAVVQELLLEPRVLRWPLGVREVTRCDPVPQSATQA